MADGSVTSTHPLFDEGLKQTKANKDAVAGQETIKKAGTKYLYPLQSMLNSQGVLTTDGTKSYQRYLQLALFFNAAGRTVDGLAGLVFRKDAVTEFSPNTEYLDDNVDASNSTLRQQMEEAVREAFTSIRSGVLVDFPDSEGDVSRADAEEQNLRPRLLRYEYENIRNWDFDTVNNVSRLCFLVLQETNYSRTSRFVIEEKLVYRVLELLPIDEEQEDGTIQPSDDSFYHFSLYDDGGTEITPPTLVLVDGEPVQEIPFYFIESDKAPVTDLVDVNLNHYNMFASYANKEFMSGFPIFWETGVIDPDNDKNVDIGPGAKWVSQNAEAQFGILETQQDGGSLKVYLDDRKTEMASLGAEMLNPTKMAAEAAESKRLDQQAQNSVTANIAIRVSEAYTMALKFAARWMGDENSDVRVELNTDYFPESVSPQMLTALLAALQNSTISYETFWANLQRGEIADPEVSAEDELKKIEQDTVDGLMETGGDEEVDPEEEEQQEGGEPDGDGTEE